jgi:hypothetical protein
VDGDAGFVFEGAEFDEDGEFEDVAEEGVGLEGDVEGGGEAVEEPGEVDQVADGLGFEKFGGIGGAGEGGAKAVDFFGLVVEEEVVLHAHVFEDFDRLLVEVEWERLVCCAADFDVVGVGSGEFDHRFTKEEGVVLKATV